MSEPVSSEEIENVLSSIRRLVSTDENQPEEAQTRVETSTLVLTSALRVKAPANDAENTSVENPAAAVEFHHSKPKADAKPGAEEPVQTSSLESTIAELEAVVGKQGGEWEPDGADDAAPAAAPKADAKPAAASPKPATKAKPAAKAKPKTAAKTDPPVDEALKTMVAALMREELKGALGTKITRDVRKVVRQEVRLALKSQSNK